ncbi:Serine/Threonine kinase domain protein (macronuclear) [Tetrahymena thermophila SB210]|uniref:Serine/Threonine kinase domain protein n=1 Tax=Tetrahymena thermophila (strain SB210) TaxID=312017 RepID=I7M6R7_TETTS|nr:Serine/Threonine kinase domain protein [Tetrahymena thermophila SB210]EAR85698.3 Serine/Threonine kinase domain protein [Tetrahymena thermophila SB210]|eukprot:XP_001033361.3 Serine/Threonine kinase domain protein [Tetrahymena thermophila SB210]
MNQIQSEASKNVQEAQSIKQTSQLFPQYQFKKNLQSPQKGGYSNDMYSGINPNTILSFNLQTNQAVQISLAPNDLKTPNIGKANNLVLGGNSYSNQTPVQQQQYPSINAQYSFQSAKDSQIANPALQKPGESNLKYEAIQSQQPQYNSLNVKNELNQTPQQMSYTQNPLVQQSNTNFSISNQNVQGSNNFNQGSSNSVNFVKSPNSSNSTIGQSAQQGNSSFFSNIGQQQLQNNQRASIEVSMAGVNNSNGSKINSTNSANIQGGQQNQNLLYNAQSQSQTFSSNQGASSNNQTIIDTRTQVLGQGPGVGMISLDSSYTNLASNTILGQSQGPQIIPSNENLSIITPQDMSNITNVNYFNFQDLTLTSHQNSQIKTTTNQNLNYNEQNILQNLKNNSNNLQSNNIQPQSFSPAPTSISKKQDYSYSNKQTSVTANNTPYKQSISGQSNTGKIEIKNPNQLNLQNDIYSKNFIQPAQSPGRLGLNSTKVGNSFANNNFDQQEHNKINSNRHSQNQKSLNGVSTSSNALTIIGNTQQQGQLLPSQQQLVQSIVLQKNRSQSPNNIKSSKNYGQTSPSFSKLGYQQNNLQSNINLSSNTGQTQHNYLSPNYLYNAANSSSHAIKKLPCKESQSPENRDKNLSSNNYSNQNNNQQFTQAQPKPSNSPSSYNYTTPQQHQQQVSQSSYYKVASQIRRNQLKEKRPSVLNSENSANAELIQSVKCGSVLGSFASSQLNINSSVNVGAVENPQQQLIYSQNYGKALPINDQQKQQYLQQQKELQQKVLSAGTKRQSSTGSQGSKSQDKKDQKKRFTVVDKFNEKYTKKLIIDLCNYMNNSNDGQVSESTNKQTDNQQISQDEEDPIKRTSSRKGNWQNNSNLNMIEILSQQRVLQRSVSNQKRNILSHNNKSSDITGSNPISSNTKHINLNNNLLTPSKSTQSASKRFSFRYTDKPWENTSFQNNSKFNSKYGSFSVMRSMNNSQSNWNLNGSQHLNSSINGEIQGGGLKKNIKISSNVQLNMDGKTNSKKKNSSNFILEGFNDSQEISSSRNQKTKATHKNKNASDNINILNKHTGGTDTKSFSIQNSTNKYKFQSTSNNHLSKPNTSSNAFQKQQQQHTINKKSNRGSAHIDPSNQQQKIKISPQINSLKQEKQTFSPQLSSQANSKNSTKSEIKKSQIINAPSISQINKNRFSENNYSQHASFDKAQEHEDLEREEEYVEDEDFDEENHIEDFENEDEEEELEVHSQTDESNNSSKAIPVQGTQQHFLHDQGLTQINQPIHQHHASNQDQQRPNTITPQYQYNFESNLEQVFGVNLNIEELKKERQKLIRKITSTFKVKNKALSTSQEYYKVLHVIGKGAFAKVCLAVQLLTGKFVAIKLIDKSILRSESAKKRVLQEVQILKKLNNHKHVLKLLEVFENRKLIFIVTEYFRGQDLMKMMKERNGEPYTENQVRYMLTQIISGLRYIHGNMVLHRDIKLDNILVDSQLNLKIIDFGISRIILKDQKMMEQCGTPAFLAPEIIANKGYEGFGSDLWSLGVLIYILLFGKVPFKGNNLTELHRNILNGVLPLDEMRETNVSQEAQDLLQKILKLKVKERINLEGIANSAWMRGYQIPEGIENKQLHYKQQQQQQLDCQQNFDIQTSAGSSDQFDEKIIGQIEGFGYSREYILRCLNKGGLSHVNAIYKLIKNSNTNNNNNNNNQNFFYS